MQGKEGEMGEKARVCVAKGSVMQKSNGTTKESMPATRTIGRDLHHIEYFRCWKLLKRSGGGHA